ncbi:MAG: hypothetical protein HKM95_06760 [Inquilinus sp.]|nr:hypothetical protein [Inquilinus sp.]
MRLPRGVTGLADPNAGPARPPVSAKLARTVAHAATLAAGGVVVEERAPDGTPNFHLFHVEAAGERVAVLIHLTHRLVAFAEPLVEGSTELAFRDHPPLAAAFEETTGFRPLSAAELGEPLTAADCADLDEVERKAVRYWRPQTAGAAIFNWLD